MTDTETPQTGVQPAALPAPDPWGTPLPVHDTKAAGTPARVRFACYYEAHLTQLIRHLMRQGAAPHEAADAAQVAFTEAFLMWQSIEHPAAWLRKVAFRAYLRQSPRDEITDTPPERPGGPCPLHAVELKEEEQRVYAALAMLPAAQRQALAWSLDGFTASEIATELGTSPQAVRQNLSRARSRLKTLLGLPDGGTH